MATRNDSDGEHGSGIRFSAWNFLLQTNSTYHLNTTYVIRIYPNDGTVYNAMISIKR